MTFWYNFTNSLRWQREQKELEGLIKWAKRKRLPKIGRYYRFRLLEAEKRLGVLTIHHPGIVELSRWWMNFGQALLPPRKHRKGFAARYRMKAANQ